MTWKNNDNCMSLVMNIQYGNARWIRWQGCKPVADLRPTPSRHWQHILNVQGSSLFGGRAAKRTLCDVIATVVVLISDVIREAGKLVIYIATLWHSLMYKRIQWVEIRVKSVERLRSHL